MARLCPHSRSSFTPSALLFRSPTCATPFFCLHKSSRSKPPHFLISLPNSSRSSSSSSTSPVYKLRTTTLSGTPAKPPKSWTSLTLGQKAARTTEQSFNLLLILAGAALTTGIGYALYHELIAPDGRTRLFNAAVERVRADRRCVEALAGVGNGGGGGITGSASRLGSAVTSWWRGALGGKENEGNVDGVSFGTNAAHHSNRTLSSNDDNAWKKAAKQLYAHGEATSSRWTRNRAVANTSWTDASGVEHVKMQFYVRGGEREGICHLHVTKTPGMSFGEMLSAFTSSLSSWVSPSPSSSSSSGAESSAASSTTSTSATATAAPEHIVTKSFFGTKIEYQYLFLDVPGHERIVLEDKAGRARTGEGGGSGAGGEFRFLGVKWR